MQQNNFVTSLYEMFNILRIFYWHNYQPDRRLEERLLE